MYFQRIFQIQCHCARILWNVFRNRVNMNFPLLCLCIFLSVTLSSFTRFKRSTLSTVVAYSNVVLYLTRYWLAFDKMNQRILRYSFLEFLLSKNQRARIQISSLLVYIIESRLLTSFSLFSSSLFHPFYRGFATVDWTTYYLNIANINLLIFKSIDVLFFFCLSFRPQLSTLKFAESFALLQ